MDHTKNVRDNDKMTNGGRRGNRRRVILFGWGLSLRSGPDEKVASDFTSVPDPSKRREHRIKKISHKKLLVSENSSIFVIEKNEYGKKKRNKK